MKKILAVFAVLLTVFLVSCGSSKKIDYLVVSANKVVYSEIDNEVGERLEGSIGTPKIDQNEDFNIYAVYTDSSVEAITTAYTFETRRIEVIDQNNAIFEVTVRAQGLTTTYEVYATDNTLTSGAAVVGAMHITSTDVSEVSNALTTVLANDYDRSLVKLLVATRSGTELNVDPVIDEANYNIMKHGKQELRLKYEDLSLPFTVKVFKPGNDNAIPIRTEYANFWDWVFIIPVAFIMQLFSGLLFNSFAFGILMATIIIRTLAWPIYARSNDLSLRMAVAQPDLNRIQQKYATRQDPVSKQKMQLEIMQVYKKHRISILGCFTPLLQMPLFLAVYQTVHRITVPGGMYADRVTNTTFLWMDLSVGNELTSSLILAAIVGISMYVLQKISSARPNYMKQTGTQVQSEQQAQQQKTMRIMNIVMIGFMTLASFSYNALAFYWIVGNLYSIGQMLINRKLSAKRFEKMQSL